MDNQARKCLMDTLVFSSLFFIIAAISLYLSNIPNIITKFWFANIVGIILLLRYEARLWVIPLIGISVINVITDTLFGNNLLISSSDTIINLIEIIFTVIILKRYRIVEYFDQNIKSAIILILTIVLIAPVLNATLKTSISSTDNPTNFWVNHFVSDGVCMMLLPLSLCLMRKLWHGLKKLAWIKIFLWTLLIISITLPVLLYLPYAFIIILSPLLIASVFTCVFTTLLLASFNLLLVFTLYNASIFIPLITIKFEKSLFIYLPAILTFIIPYLLVIFMVILRKAQEDVKHREALFRSAMESSAVGMAMVSLDGYWFMVNNALCKILEYSQNELRNLKVQDITHPEDMANTLNVLRKLKTGEIDTFNTEKRYISKSGKTVWAHLSVSAVCNEDGTPQYYVENIEDITQNKALALVNTSLTNELYREKEHLKILLSSIVDSVIATDKEGLITFMNPEAEKITGWRFDKAKGLSIEAVFKIVDKDNKLLKNPVTYCLENQTGVPLLEYALLLNKVHEKYDIQYSLSFLQDKEKKIVGAEVVFQNITKTKSLQDELSYHATHDSLTGLLNRREFEKALNHAVEEYTLKGTQHIVCYLDLDFFKIVNDSAGHTAGDALLQEIAGLLHQRLRKVDVLARLGGDEFGILLLNSSLRTGRKICQQLIDLINAIRFPWKNKIYRIGVSIGMVLICDRTLSAIQQLTNADVACYAAKAEGRNRIFVYEADKAESMEHHYGLLLASTIQNAMEHNHLVLYVQKIVSAGPAKVTKTHFEILIRLLTENNNIIAANIFVTIAERFNLMAAIDRWVISQILGQYDKELCQYKDTFFSINISANSLNDPAFLPFLLSLIKNSAFVPQQLCFEITETAAMSHISNAMKIVSELQKIGCKIAIDDFGVGLSSFTYIKNFAVDFIKIDGSFVKNILESDVDKTIVQTINDMAHRLGMKTIAEFVENEAIAKVIAELGIDYLQGYYIGKPKALDTLLPD